MDKHLVFLVKQTERYTQMLADNMQQNLEDDVDGNINPENSSLETEGQSKKRKRSGIENGDEDSSQQASTSLGLLKEKKVSFDLSQRKEKSQPLRPQRKVQKINHNESFEHLDDEDDDEFFAVDDEEVDDETTLIEQEQIDSRTYQEEVDRLKAESEMPIEELVAHYRNLESSNGSTFETVDGEDEDDEYDESCIQDEDNEREDEGDDDDEEFMPMDEDAEDDEKSLIEQEEIDKLDTSANRKEIELLQAEGDIPIEKLREMYNGLTSFEDEEGEDSNAEDEEDEIEISLSNKDDSDLNDDDDEFTLEESEADDETSLIEQEMLDNSASSNNPKQEIEALKADCEIPIEQLKAMYSSIPDEDSEKSANSDSYDCSVDDESEHEDDEFIPQSDEEEFNDESELIEQENHEKQDSTSYEEELNLLQAESELSIEELRAKYYSSNNGKELSDDDSNVDEVDQRLSQNSDRSPIDSDNDSGDGVIEDDDQADEDSFERDDEAINAKAAVEGEDQNLDVDAAFRRLEAADLAARSIKVDRPFILAPNLVLREYQQIGLNWLVSLQERRLNGILADEMGLGKTVQTIGMLAHLAVMKGIWGPHLIVVPTSCIVNWETELKRFCPIFKVLTYFGSSKARKLLRTGWSKANTYHICITSYQLVVQDSSAFRRKRWYYMILDEAHNIKNFKSKRWQTLLNFNTQRRLLLTGTPLQNNLMELWSLMHFLMPHIFRSRKEFSYWFSNPLTGMVEGNRSVNNELISRLHGIMRPFLLRRLKKDVAKQLPGKFEHIVSCKLSKRQLHLYEEFMARSTTRASLSGGNFLGMMNILMQLRKVCNHPDLFEARPISSPFIFEGFGYHIPSLIPRISEEIQFSGLSTELEVFWKGSSHDSIAVESMSRLALTKNQFILIDDISLEDETSSLVWRCPKFTPIIHAMAQSIYNERLSRAESNFIVSNRRCHLANGKNIFVVDWRTNRLLRVRSFTERIIQGKLDIHLLRDTPGPLVQMIRSIDERAVDLEEMISNFVFVLPKVVSSGPKLVAGAFSARGKKSDTAIEHEPTLKRALDPFYNSRIRQTIFFPDKKLIQFDSGKLQTLAVLLAKLKRENHKCLIFTQMSKMLDILEIFLNLHSHTFVRLDGSTGIYSITILFQFLCID